MAFRDLIPWNNQGRNIVQQSAYVHPFLALHREMNRMFDDVFRGFDLARFGSARAFEGLSWPQIEIDETDKEVRITAELPGLQEKDVSLNIANGVLSISGEKKSETEDKDRRFSERYFGRFERRIPLEGVDQDNPDQRQELIAWSCRPERSNRLGARAHPLHPEGPSTSFSSGSGSIPVPAVLSLSVSSGLAWGPASGGFWSGFGWRSFSRFFA